jgi:hypothetical protein
MLERSDDRARARSHKLSYDEGTTTINKVKLNHYVSQYTGPIVQVIVYIEQFMDQRLPLARLSESSK